MLTYGFLADGLMTLSQPNMGNDLDRYCKLEGMDYQRLAHESHRLKNLFGKKKYLRIEAVHASTAN